MESKVEVAENLTGQRDMAAVRTVQLSALPPGMREVLRNLPRFTSDHRWLQANWARLLARYDGQWIAVHGRKVVAHDSDLRQLVEKLAKQDIRPSSAAINYVTSEERLLLF